MKYSVAVTLMLAFVASAAPSPRAAFTKQNGLDAIALNKKFKTLTAQSKCTTGDQACVTDKFAQCDNGKFVLTACGGGTICAALPLVNKAGTSIACTTAADLAARIAATGATDTGSTPKASSSTKVGKTTATSSATSVALAATSTKSSGGGKGAQSSLTIDPKVLAKGFENDGQDVPAAGQVASITSGNNFINFCLTVPKLPITNGQQVKTGSCNPAPMGIIAATTAMPACKFKFPKNGATIAANKDFTVQLAIKNLETGHFVNALSNYFAGPQQTNGAGQVIGHSHIVIEKLSSLDSTTPGDGNKFAFFKGLNEKAVNGVLSADVAGGLPEGFYKVSSINTAANHQPVLVAVAQHASLDDVSYFTVGKPKATKA